MKLSIVIVSWNVRELLKECLESVLCHAPSFPFEVFVVDNSSSDGSAEMVQKDFSNISLIANPDNRGFAVACNQAIRQAKGEYILLLNPDCHVIEHTLDQFISFLDDHKRAGIAGCRILNPDGSLQKSIRRFPIILSQLLIFFKVHHVLPNIPILRQYLAADFNYDSEQYVDQPMGAAFMIRKSCLDEIGLLDERFFIWFEEVDLCKRAHDRGWEVWYTPLPTVIHHKGQSFKKQNIVQNQINTFTSCSQYLWKYFAWKSIVAVCCMRLYVALLAISRMKLFWSIIALELISIAGYFFEPLNVFGFLFVVLLTFALSVQKLEYGLALVVAELAIGSKGHLFSLGIGDGAISVRMGIFCALFLAWVVYVASGILQKRKNTFSFLRSSYAPWYGIIGIVSIVAIITGIARGTSLGAIYADANAWIFFLLVPICWDTVQSRTQFLLFAKVFIAASATRIATILALFYIMGHKGFGFDVIYSVYRWARTTGLAEITQFDFSVSRIFLQSQIYDLILFCILIMICGSLLHSRKILSRTSILLLAVGAITSIIVSLSRSYWLAVILVIPFIVYFIVRYYSWKVLVRTALLFAALTCASLIVLVVVSRIPIPSTEGGFEFDILAKRVSDLGEEAAAASRWNLLPVLIDTIRAEPLLGYGFGKAVTYYSKDPRVLETNPSGAFTTYAYEWGYLDMLIKFGFIGFAVYLLFLGTLLKRGWQYIVSTPDGQTRALSIGLWCGLVALLITHMFSPYLNHPLGIGYIIAYSLYFDVIQRRAIIST
ncbi:MAG: glycosyltransferase [Patescibacteria group bacterium]